MPDERLAKIMTRGFDTLADLLRETNASIHETNARLDETNARVSENGMRIVEVRDGLRRLEGRFDNFVDIAGTETRRLSAAVDELERRVGALEKKAS